MSVPGPRPPEGGEREGTTSREKEKPYNPVEYGHAWTHGFLNQKPWHPLSFKNQIRKYEVEQKYIEDEKRREAAKKQFELEQEHYKSVSYLDSKGMKDYKDRQELAFMYVKPPGLESTSKKDESIQEDSNPSVAVKGLVKDKGPMVTMLKGQALCLENNELLHRGLSPVHGGFDPSDENQQLIFSQSDESVPDESKRKRRKRQLKEEVKHAEETLAAAGYDVKKINKHLRKTVKKKKKRKQ